MAVIYQRDLTDLNNLVVCDLSSEIVQWQGCKALKLNGLAIMLDLSGSQIQILPAYSG
jgi:hypothetical protein